MRGPLQTITYSAHNPPKSRKLNSHVVMARTVDRSWQIKLGDRAMVLPKIFFSKLCRMEDVS